MYQFPFYFCMFFIDSGIFVHILNIACPTYNTAYHISSTSKINRMYLVVNVPNGN